MREVANASARTAIIESDVTLQVRRAWRNFVGSAVFFAVSLIILVSNLKGIWLFGAATATVASTIAYGRYWKATAALARHPHGRQDDCVAKLPPE
jgi:hypothetical protein